MRLFLLAGSLLLLFLLFLWSDADKDAAQETPAAVVVTATAVQALGSMTMPTHVAAAQAPATATEPAPTATALPLATEPPATPPATATATATPNPSPTPTPVYIMYEVQAGETLVEIAFRHGVKVEAVVEASSLADANTLVVGQQLRIPPATGDNALAGAAARDYGYEIIGFSIDGHALEVFSFGEGEQHLVLVGGVHGGYEWNTVLLAYEMIDYFNGNRQLIPEGLTLHVMPVANPDGLQRVTGQVGRFTREQVGPENRDGRFNGRFVDLNRNWACDWSASARWGSRQVDPGTGPFSEPETRALRDYLLRLQPAAVLFWHSKAHLVAPGVCGEDAGSSALAQRYAGASGYPMKPFTAYELSGTASDWANSQGIPSVAIELTGHESTEFGQNLAGVLAVIEWISGSGE